MNFEHTNFTAIIKTFKTGGKYEENQKEGENLKRKNTPRSQ